MKTLILALTLGALAWGQNNIRWTQISVGDRHGTDAKGQSSDGTATTGHVPVYDSNGGLTNGPTTSITVSGVTCTLGSSCDPGPVIGANAIITCASSLGTSTGCGLTIPGTSLTAGRMYYVGASFVLTAAKADSSATLPGICLAVTTTACAFSGAFRFSSTQSWTAGQILYVSDSSAGALVSTAPSTSGHFVQRVGVALAADTILMMPSIDVGTIQ